MSAQSQTGGTRLLQASVRLVAIPALALLCAPSLNAGVNRWTSQGPWAGLITAVAVDPTDPQTVYVAALYDGIFRTRDGGATWQAVNQGLRSFFIYSLVLDPLQPTTLYAGAQYSFVSKSLDRGDHWESQYIATFDSAYESVYQLAVDPANFGTVYAATNDGVWKTTDGGCSWYESNNGLPSQLTAQTIVLDPTDPSVLYLRDLSPGRSKSTDGGDSWTPSSSGLLYIDVNGFAVDPNDPNTVYAAQSYFADVGPPPQVGGAVFKSPDGGGNWSVLPDLPNLQYSSVAIDPFNHAVVFATSGGGRRFSQRRLRGDVECGQHRTSRTAFRESVCRRSDSRNLLGGNSGGPASTRRRIPETTGRIATRVAGVLDERARHRPRATTRRWGGATLWGSGARVFETTDSGLTWTLSTTGLGTSASSASPSRRFSRQSCTRPWTSMAVSTEARTPAAPGRRRAPFRNDPPLRRRRPAIGPFQGLRGGPHRPVRQRRRRRELDARRPIAALRPGPASRRDRSGDVLRCRR